ncbi:uncharacterized protein LOC134408318 [Elgaria multicarinata webbii]|uniref:uncharacterized protein LOC134408318 n=1 Tax=Elgaria multicarinata webbii TaxID=159646 RepID=UPI002FCD2635
MEETIPSKTKVKMPTERRIVSNPNTLAEKALENQIGVEEQETLSQNNSMCRSKNLDSCWFLLEIDEVIDGVSVCVTDEEKKSRELGCEDVLLDHGFGFPQSENKSTYPSLSDDVTIINPCVIEKETMPREHKEPSDGEINNVEEEESLQPQQSQGVQIVFYELLGSVVKLLGTPSVNYETINLAKLTELEDSSVDKSHDECMHFTTYMTPQTASITELFSIF